MTSSRTPWPRHRVVTCAILAVGWAIALVVWVTAATPVVENPDVEDLLHSKRYLRQTEMIGGKAAVLGNDLREWFDGLWQGRELAYTIEVLTALVALGYYLWATTAPPAPDER
jgi:hypothetical protein